MSAPPARDRCRSPRAAPRSSSPSLQQEEKRRKRDFAEDLASGNSRRKDKKRLPKSSSHKSRSSKSSWRPSSKDVKKSDPGPTRPPRQERTVLEPARVLRESRGSRQLIEVSSPVKMEEMLDSSILDLNIEELTEISVPKITHNRHLSATRDDELRSEAPLASPSKAP